MNSVSIRRSACLLAVGGVLALTQVVAREPGQKEAKPVQTEAKSAGKTRPAGGQAPATQTALPACLEKLKLTAAQQTQAHEIADNFDARLEATWKQFGEKYMETVRTEVALLAAIEDSLTEKQRTQVRDQRRKAARSGQPVAGADGKVKESTTEPTDAAEDVIAQIDISLTDEQEANADKIHEKYVSHLRTLNREIRGLHSRLVSLEADKLVEFEKILTKEQLAELQEGRQNMTPLAKLTSVNKQPAKAE